MEGLDARHALLDRLIDHAPTFPPASLVSDEALDEDARAVRSPHSFALARLVWPASRLGEIAGTERGVSAVLDASLPENAEIEAVEARYRDDLAELQGLAREVYVEVPVDAALRAAARRGRRARSAGEGAMRRSRRSERRGARGLRSWVPGARVGVQGDRRAPSRRALERRARLPQPARGRGLRGAMRRRRSRRPTRTRSRSTRDAFSWHGQSAGASELVRVRRELFHSIGSCSFFEPVEELRSARDASLMTGGVGFGVFSVGGDSPRVGFRVGHDVLDLAAHGLGAVFDAPTLNPFLALGRTSWEDTIARIDELVRAGADLVPLEDADVGLPFTVERLRRLLLLARARDEPRTSLPAGHGAAAAELAPPAGRVPRSRGDGRRERDADRAPVRPGEAPDRGRPALRAEPAARHRARDRLRGRSRQSPRRAGEHGGVPRPCLRRRPRQRLERA